MRTIVIITSCLIAGVAHAQQNSWDKNHAPYNPATVPPAYSTGTYHPPVYFPPPAPRPLDRSNVPAPLRPGSGTLWMGKSLLMMI
jgi:hypothetical protein